MTNICDLESWRRKILFNYKSKKIIDLKSHKLLFSNISSLDIKNKLYSKSISDIVRIDNCLFFSFKSRESIGIKFSNQAHFSNQETKINTNAILIIVFDDYTRLSIVDPTNLTRAEFMIGKVENSRLIENSGKDISQIDFREFTSIINYTSPRSASIFELLTDKNIISGLNSDIINETLYVSKVRPDTKISSLGSDLIELIYKNLADLLTESLKKIISKSSYEIVEPFWFKTYNRSNKKCTSCGKKFTTKVVKRHSSIYCNVCQKLIK